MGSLSQYLDIGIIYVQCSVPPGQARQSVCLSVLNIFIAFIITHVYKGFEQKFLHLKINMIKYGIIKTLQNKNGHTVVDI